jgi:hypothetical protein
MSASKKLTSTLANAAAGGGLNVDDVFSTYLYEGNGSTQTITNGIDLDGEGGMVWQKRRSSTGLHFVMDTERNPNSFMYTNLTVGDGIGTSGSSFNSDGFTIGSENNLHNTGDEVVSWTFRKAPKFFDVVTYTGNGVTGRTVSHNLGSTPGMIIVKRTDTTGSWIVYHRGMDVSSPENYHLTLNYNFGLSDLGLSPSNPSNMWDQTAPTSTEFTVGADSNVNASGSTYVAYLFAHNDGDGEFGESGDQDIIKCGSYTGTGSNFQEIDVGFEPQWLMVKGLDRSCDWVMFDNMRPWPTGGTTAFLRANTSAAEATNFLNVVNLTPNGFSYPQGGFGSNVNENNEDYIYIAIRRPMKTPESGTEVFAIDKPVSPGSETFPYFTSGFPVDMFLYRTNLGLTRSTYLKSRLTGNYLALKTDSTDAEASHYNNRMFDSNTGIWEINFSNSDDICWMFKRAPGFFDVVCYTGTGSARTVNHNLGVAPELMIIKARTDVQNWLVYPNNEDEYLLLNTNGAQGAYSFFDSTAPTSTQFTIGSSWSGSGSTYVAYLFASLDGISKVFSVTKSSGSDASVDCGFSSGPRFVMLKRTDSTGDWYIWDTERGIVAGNDPYLLLNSTAAEVTNTDYIDPTASGFSIVNGGLADGDYIGLAVS